MGKLSSLLRWKVAFQIKDEEDKPLEKVWLRIIGDDDAQEAYAAARVRSSAFRRSLRDETTVAYQDNVLALKEATKEQAIDIITAGQENNFISQATVSIERPDLPKLETIAIDADIPTLEEQEKFDALVEKINKEYVDAQAAYVDARKATLLGELGEKTLEELIDMAQIEVANIMALRAFVDELTDEKTWRAVYTDEACKERGFDDVFDFKATREVIKEQLKRKYVELEANGDNVKN